MKQVFIIIFSLFTVIVLGQNSTKNNDIVFKFKNKTEFTEQFKNRTIQKEYSFIVTGVTSEKQAEVITENISNSRGVERFILSELNSDGSRIATLKVYKYADHWKYYEFLFSNNGINKILINNSIYLPSELEKL